MTLYFGTYDVKRVIDTPETVDDAFRTIRKFCADRDFKIYYVREWIDEDNGWTQYDVGDYTHFFWLDKGDRKDNDDGN